MYESPATSPAGSRPQIVARYELDDDGVAWKIHIATDRGEFAASATRLQDVEMRACQTIAAVLELPAGSYELELIHVLNLDTPERVR